MAYLHCTNSLTGDTFHYTVGQPITSIGRAKSNNLTLEDAGISHSHATLIKKQESVRIATTSPSAHLYVNGKRKQQHTLTAGDELLIGVWLLTFHTGPTPKKEKAAVTNANQLRSLEQMAEISKNLMKDTAPNRLFKQLLSGVVELTGAEKGFVIVFKGEERHIASAHNVDPDSIDTQHISDSIVNQVIDSLKPIIVSDALVDKRFGNSKSVVDLKLSSVLCVPLIFRSDLLGVIYLGNDSVTDLFNNDDLSLMVIYASMASVVVHNALLMNQLMIDNQALRAKLKGAAQGEIIGKSPAMKAIFKVIKRIAPTDLSFMVLGETGTGKELAAREAHKLSDRSSGPFVAINCGAIPENLLESELFGHKKGAFTGATTDKVGKIESANGGTLFLDEIGEMPMNLQVKLLRVLQDRTIERVGDLQTRAIDVRVVSATNKSPKTLIESGLFREDLYYRLNEITITLPPLRDRGNDVELLANYFLHKYSDRYETKSTGFTSQAMKAMKKAKWTGNVRELESKIKRALVLTDRALINPSDLDLVDADVRKTLPLAEAQEQFKQEYILRALERNNQNKAQTARDLDVDARTIFRCVEKLNETT